ncbi:hypothetical protein DFS33DRAFT_1377192 [Desarmillaria ectypa]|nr:hypothetical protein DFS33DRAFT_1377192 [Desarmillaria ectypa]
MSDLGELPYAVPHKTLGVLLVALTVSSSWDIWGDLCTDGSVLPAAFNSGFNGPEGFYKFQSSNCSKVFADA